MKVLALLLLTVATTGCSTFAANRYSISADNVVALREFGTQTVGVGEFTSSEPGLSVLYCRMVGPIEVPDQKPFADYVRKALVDEMRIAKVYSDQAPVTLTGNLDKIHFSSVTGTWELVLTVNSSNGSSTTVAETFDYTTSYFGAVACDQTAQALMPAVQNLIERLVTSPDFPRLINSKDSSDALTRM